MNPLKRRHALRLLCTVLMAGASLPLLTGATQRIDTVAVASPSRSATITSQQTQKHLTVGRPAALTPEAASVLFAIAHRTADASRASALFAPKSWYVPPPPPPPTPQREVVPSAPPLPFAFLGRYTDGNGVTVYFVTRDDRVYDVKPGDAIDAIYSVEAIENERLIFLYKPLNERQSLPLGEAP